MAQMKLEQANRIIEVALAKAREMNLPPVGVAVMDAGGHLVAMQREDGLSFLRVKVCQAKAYATLAMGAHTSQLAQRFATNVNMQGFFAALNQLSGGQVIPVAGGVLIRDGAGEMVGGVGVSGAASEEDESCAVAGIEAAGFKVEL